MPIVRARKIMTFQFELNEDQAADIYEVLVSQPEENFDPEDGKFKAIAELKSDLAKHFGPKPEGGSKPGRKSNAEKAAEQAAAEANGENAPAPDSQEQAATGKAAIANTAPVTSPGSNPNTGKPGPKIAPSQKEPVAAK